MPSGPAPSAPMSFAAVSRMRPTAVRFCWPLQHHTASVRLWLRCASCECEPLRLQLLGWRAWCAMDAYSAAGRAARPVPAGSALGGARDPVRSYANNRTRDCVRQRDRIGRSDSRLVRKVRRRFLFRVELWALACGATRPIVSIRALLKVLNSPSYHGA
jgi:hypothetical protein